MITETSTGPGGCRAARDQDRGAFSVVCCMIAERSPSLRRRFLAARSVCRPMCGQRSAQRQVSAPEPERLRAATAQRQVSAPEPERLRAATSLRAKAGKTPRSDKSPREGREVSAPEPGRLRAAGSLRAPGQSLVRCAAGTRPSKIPSHPTASRTAAMFRDHARVLLPRKMTPASRTRHPASVCAQDLGGRA